MAEKSIVLPLSNKMILIEALRNYSALVKRRIDAEAFESVKSSLRKQYDDVYDVLREVEKV